MVLLLSLLLLFVSTVASAAPTTETKGVYHIDAVHYKTPDELAKRLREDFLSIHPEAKDTPTATGTSDPLSLEDYYQWLLIGNITIGSSAQNFSVVFDTWGSSDLFVASVNVQEASSKPSSCDSTSSTETTTAAECAPLAQRKHLYNESASTTYGVANTYNSVYNASWGYYGNGTFAADNVNVNGLQLPMVFGDLTYMTYSFDYYIPADGFLGLSPYNSSNNISNVQTQLLPYLNQPLITLQVYRNYSDCYGWTDNTCVIKYNTAQIVLGSNQIAGCNQSGWVYRANQDSYTWWPSFLGRFKSSSIGYTKPSGCDNSFKVNRTVRIVDYFSRISTSYQVQQIFVDATNATFNNTYDYNYVVDCNQLNTAPTISISLIDGTSLDLNPSDYIVQSTNEFGQNVCFLFVYGGYDENDPYYQWYSIRLGQQFLNNRCYSYNMAQKTFGLTNWVH